MSLLIVLIIFEYTDLNGYQYKNIFKINTLWKFFVPDFSLFVTESEYLIHFDPNGCKDSSSKLISVDFLKKDNVRL